MVVIMSQVTCLIINRFLCFLMVSRAISCYPMLSHDISCNLLESHGDSGCNTIQHAITFNHMQSCAIICTKAEYVVYKSDSQGQNSDQIQPSS